MLYKKMLTIVGIFFAVSSLHSANVAWVVLGLGEKGLGSDSPESMTIEKQPLLTEKNITGCDKLSAWEKDVLGCKCSAVSDESYNRVAPYCCLGDRKGRGMGGFCQVVGLPALSSVGVTIAVCCAHANPALFAIPGGYFCGTCMLSALASKCPWNYGLQDIQEAAANEIQ